MLALSPFFLLLLTAIHSSSASHLPSRLDAARIRTVHRRHHARRAQADCNDNIVTGVSPVVQGKRADSDVVNATSASAVSDTTAAANPDAQRLIAESSAQAQNEVGEVVKDAIEDVVTPALSKALSAISVDASGSGSGSTNTAPASNGVFVVSSSDPAVQVEAVPAPAPAPAPASPSPAPTLDANNYKAAPVAVSTCNQGDWRCDGMTLKQCNWNDWIVVRQCSGDNIVCSDQGSTVGCVWTWSVAQQGAPSPAPQPSPSPAPSPVAAQPSQAPPVQASPVAASTPKASPTASPTTTSPTQNAGSATTAPPLSPSMASTGTSPVTTSTFINEQGEECVEWEEEVWVEEEDETASSTKHSTTPSSSVLATSSALGNALAAVTPSPAVPNTSASVAASPSANAWDDDCEEWEDASSHSGSHSSTSASYSTGSQASAIGNNLAAAPKSSSWSASSTAAPTTSAASSTTTTTTTTSTSDSIGLPTQALIAATISASNEVLANLTNPSKTLSVIDASAITISKISTTSVATQGVVTATPSAVASYSAPHYVIYSDYWLFSMPDVSTLKSFNRFILAFWLSDQGPVDNAQMWTWMPAADRQKVLTSYHNAGIALMVSAFGSTDQPTTMGKDPLATAQQLAKFVVDYQFDGVDIDYEDMGAMNSDKAEAWLIPFQKELRRLLPRPYLISHAPVAPWFTSSAAYRSGAYVKIHQSAGDGIDFYNMQFYNQGDGVYTDCTSLITQSGGYWPGTSVMEMNSYAKVPLDKIVIGKPLDAGKASNGYMNPQDLNVCVKQARSMGWNGGVMFWEWTTDAPWIMATSRA